ncbi:FMN-dependent NADH-azoreductase [Pseudoduganella buxea]|uniref:FMN dependent NADH:quinone oxidoreductase n=1 Tax=Pseudoduganella buxea TaxID=1949069 RepID=A0A6I3T1F3_9BURK|nr:NAD(P)H-dependent oxidoreductase [Pseudoduganella buxea]MTV55174.1 FMN-dependent NADH-azoreductase [Pseudoduganella buxea]GGC20822.1 FMN-dependent NADH-azoreductase [Pseudoduganella buxea]
MNILQINSSARSSGSESTRLADQIVARLAAGTEATVVRRDLAAAPHPVLDEAALQALFTPADQRTPQQAERVALDDALIAQAQAADVIVIGAPMYNFGITVQLKSWFDAIARAGVTFKYGPTGPVGLLTGKKVFVAVTRGGLHKGGPSDTQLPHLRTFLSFVGLDDVQFVFSEGHGMGPDAVARARSEADEQIAALV